MTSIHLDSLSTASTSLVGDSGRAKPLPSQDFNLVLQQQRMPLLDVGKTLPPKRSVLAAASKPQPQNIAQGRSVQGQRNDASSATEREGARESGRAATTTNDDSQKKLPTSQSPAVEDERLQLAMGWVPEPLAETKLAQDRLSLSLLEESTSLSEISDWFGLVNGRPGLNDDLTDEEQAQQWVQDTEVDALVAQSAAALELSLDKSRVKNSAWLNAKDPSGVAGIAAPLLADETLDDDSSDDLMLDTDLELNSEGKATELTNKASVLADSLVGRLQPRAAQAATATQSTGFSDLLGAQTASANQTTERAQLRAEPSAFGRHAMTLAQMPSQVLADRFSQRVMMMLSQKSQQAFIRLDPPELGKLEIGLQKQDDRVQVVIHAQTTQAKEMLEQHMPRLRELLARQGIELENLDVRDQSQQGQSDQPPPGSASDWSAQLTPEDAAEVEVGLTLSNRLIDDYA